MAALITDPGFDINRTEKYRLSIQVNLDGFSFSIIAPAENKLLGMGYSPVTVSTEIFLGRRFSEWYNEQELFQKNWSEIGLIYASDKFSLVPAPFYDYHKQNKIIQENFGEHQGYSVRDNYLPEDEANLVFSIPVPLLESFEKFFPGQLILHPVSLLCKKIHQNFSNLNTPLVVLSFQGNSFNLLLYASQKLLAMNNFRFKHPNDVIYYVLSVLKSTNIKPSETTLLLTKKISQTSELFKNLSDYFINTEFIKASVQYNEGIFNESVQQLTPIL